MIWETAVGVMLPCPWAYPRKADRQPTQITAGARARMPGAAMLSFIRPASCSEPKNITRKDRTPRIRNRARASRKVRRTWFRRPRASASLTSLDTATGRPAVEMVSRTE